MDEKHGYKINYPLPHRNEFTFSSNQWDSIAAVSGQARNSNVEAEAARDSQAALSASSANAEKIRNGEKP